MKYLCVFFLIFSLNLFAKNEKTKLNELEEYCSRIDGWIVTITFNELKKLVMKISNENWDKEKTKVEILLSEKIKKNSFDEYLKDLIKDGFTPLFYKQIYKIVFQTKDKSKYQVITESIISPDECSITSPTIYLKI